MNWQHSNLYLSGDLQHTVDDITACSAVFLCICRRIIWAKRTTCHACIASMQAVSTACSISKYKVKEKKIITWGKTRFIYQLGKVKLICSTPWRNPVKASSRLWCKAKTFLPLFRLTFFHLLYFTNLSQTKSNTFFQRFTANFSPISAASFFLSHFLFPLQL